MKCGRDGLLLPIAFGNKIPKEWSDYPIAAGIKASEWNGFHDFILWDELYRGASSIASIFVGLVCSVETWKLSTDGTQGRRSSTSETIWIERLAS
jgi:hypothetical protein